MPKFNEFIKAFEEKETAPKAQEPKVETAPKVEEPKDQPKPYKTVGNLEHYIVKYDDLAKVISGNPKANFTIRSKKTGEDFDLGSASGLDFETEEEAKKTIDGWERNTQEKKDEEQPAPQKQEENVAQQKSEFNPTEPIEKYNDSYDAVTHSEREFNLETSNDRGMYEYVKKNLPTLKKLAETNPEGVIRAITRHGNYPSSFYGIEPKNVRKEYVQAVLNGFLED